MENEEKKSIEERIAQYFTNIKNHCDSGIALVIKKSEKDVPRDPADVLGLTNVFEITKKIQEEIEEIRDILFG